MSSFSFHDKDGWHTGYIHDGPTQVAQSGHVVHNYTWSELSTKDKLEYIIKAPFFTVFHLMRLAAIATAIIWVITTFLGIHEIGFVKFMIGGLVINAIKNFIIVITYRMDTGRML